MAKDPRVLLLSRNACQIRVEKGGGGTGTWLDPKQVAPDVLIPERFHVGRQGTRRVQMYSVKNGAFMGKEVFNCYYYPNPNQPSKFVGGYYIMADVFVFEKTMTRTLLDEQGEPVVDLDTGEPCVEDHTFRYVDIVECESNSIPAQHFVRFSDEKLSAEAFEIGQGFWINIDQPEPLNLETDMFEYTCTCGKSFDLKKPWRKEGVPLCEDCRPTDTKPGYAPSSKKAAPEPTKDELDAINAALGGSKTKRVTLADVKGGEVFKDLADKLATF